MCNEENISALIDGELSAGDAEALRLHMESCASCRALYEDFLAISGGFSDVQAPDTLAPGIAYKIELGEETPRIRRIVGSLIGIAACLVAAIIISKTAEPRALTDVGDMSKAFQRESLTESKYSFSAENGVSGGGSGIYAAPGASAVSPQPQDAIVSEDNIEKTDIAVEPEPSAEEASASPEEPVENSYRTEETETDAQSDLAENEETKKANEEKTLNKP